MVHMRKVEKLPSGRYKVRFRLGQRQTSESFDTHRAATDFAKALDAVGAQEAVDLLYDGEQQAQVPTLDQVAADHIDLLTGITDGTRLTYHRQWARTWGKRIGHLQANRVGRDDVARALNQLAQTYSAKSLANHRGLLSGVMGRCVEHGWQKSNPARGMRLPRGKEHERPDMRIFTHAELADLFATIHPHYRPLVVFLAGTGCRWGEAAALTIGDVALPDVRIRRAIKWSPDNKTSVGPTKTRKSNRTLRLPPEVVDVLEPLLIRDSHELVFTAPQGGPLRHRTFWSDIWLPAVKHLSPRPRIHDLRHTHASLLLAAGVPIHVVQARLGHESIQTTVDTYSHLLPDAQQAAASAASLALRAPEPPRQLV